MKSLNVLEIKYSINGPIHFEETKIRANVGDKIFLGNGKTENWLEILEITDCDCTFLIHSINPLVNYNYFSNTAIPQYENINLNNELEKQVKVRNIKINDEIIISTNMEPSVAEIHIKLMDIYEIKPNHFR